jgi:hypothetical protein
LRATTSELDFEQPVIRFGMSYRIIYQILRIFAVACFAGAVLLFFTLQFSPSQPDATHIYSYKGFYLTVEQVRGYQVLIGSFVISGLASEAFRKLDEKSVGKSKYFY